MIHMVNVLFMNFSFMIVNWIKSETLMLGLASPIKQQRVF